MATSIYLSKITKVDLRDCWQNEATEHTHGRSEEQKQHILSIQTEAEIDDYTRKAYRVTI